MSDTELTSGELVAMKCGEEVTTPEPMPGPWRKTASGGWRFGPFFGDSRYLIRVWGPVSRVKQALGTDLLEYESDL